MWGDCTELGLSDSGFIVLVFVGVMSSAVGLALAASYCWSRSQEQNFVLDSQHPALSAYPSGSQTISQRSNRLPVVVQSGQHTHHHSHLHHSQTHHEHAQQSMSRPPRATAETCPSCSRHNLEDCYECLGCGADLRLPRGNVAKHGDPHPTAASQGSTPSVSPGRFTKPPTKLPRRRREPSKKSIASERSPSLSGAKQFTSQQLADQLISTDASHAQHVDKTQVAMELEEVMDTHPELLDTPKAKGGGSDQQVSSDSSRCVHARVAMKQAVVNRECMQRYGDGVTGRLELAGRGSCIWGHVIGSGAAQIGIGVLTSRVSI